MKQSAKKSGFTLIETLVAIVILSVGIVGVLHAFDASIVAFGIARDRLHSTSLIKDKITDLEIQVWEQGNIQEISSDGWFSSPYTEFRWEVSIGDEITFSEMSGEDIGHLYKTRVKVWRDGSDRSHAVSTYIRSRPEKEDKW